MRVTDAFPTVLYATGLPAAEDFTDRARTELFNEEFSNAVHLRAVRTWGMRAEGEDRASEVDEELVDQLRALGYTD